MAAAHPLPSSQRAPQIGMLADGRRLHLNDGPIDLVIEAVGAPDAVAQAYGAAAERFTGLLDALCTELPALRAPVTGDDCPLQGKVARRMWEAVRPFADDMFITPMAAVAGAVAEEVLAALARSGVTRAYVNNGGDIALYLPAGASFTVGLVDRPDHPRLVGTAVLTHASPVRGVATSGWRGRSFSLGIADAVTILAPTAAMADAAATVVANAVNLPGHPGVLRVPAHDILPDSDLAGRLVTRDVPDLSARERGEALAAGYACAEDLIRRGLICAAALHLQGESIGVGAGLAHLSEDVSTGGLPAAGLLPTPQPEQGRVHAEVKIRKRLLIVEEILHEGGPVAATPRKRGAILAVIENPFAGRYVEEIAGFMDDLTPLGVAMAGDLLAALGGDKSAIDGYGKGAIVGAAGELEHGALWHVPGGYAMREILGDAKAIVPSTKKVGGPGTRLDVPITHVNASYVRSHFDAMEVGVPDGPKADEIVLALVMTMGARVHARVGGLAASAIKGEDGLR